MTILNYSYMSQNQQRKALKLQIILESEKNRQLKKRNQTSLEKYYQM